MKIIKHLFMLIFLFLSCTQMAIANVQDRESFTQALKGKNSTNKEQAINWLLSTQSEKLTKTVLTAWLEGDLYYSKDKQSEYYQQLFFSTDLKKTKSAKHVWSDQIIPILSTRKFKKIRVNNKLRSILKLNIATLSLADSDVNTRLESVKAMLGKADTAVINTLSQRLKVEKNVEVKYFLTLAIIINEAQQGQAQLDKITAIKSLSEYKHVIVLQTLNSIIDKESDEVVLTAAKRALDKYKHNQEFYSSIETLFFGLSLGSVLVLASIGLAITFGVMGVINMAHGELIMIGAYTTYVIQQLMPNNLGMALILSIPVAFIVSGLVGILIERVVIRHLYGRPLETLLATFGISLILQQVVRTIFSPLNRSVSSPEWMAGALQLNPMLSITYNRLYIFLFCIIVFVALLFILKKTSLGLQVRAVSQNRSMARAMGIRSERVDVMTFGLGSGVAGVAGVALSQLSNVGPNMGQSYIIDSFMVVVFGGVGNLWGTLVAGLSLGMLNKFMEPWAGAVLAKILVLVMIILFIQKRPRGLFPQRGRAAES